MSSKDKLVSVVVPVYNSEKHLRQCIDSVLAQTYGNLELICVDDGSSDSSLEILLEYAANDSRVKVMSQENGGPGIARNNGMNVATGEYLYFLDADDYCKSALLELAVDCIEKTDADMAVFPYFEFDQRVVDSRQPWWAILVDKFPEKELSWRDNPDWIFQAFQNFPWNKVFKTSFIKENNICYQDIRLTEDLMFIAPALVLAQKIVRVDEALVYHRQGTGENTMAHKDNHPLDFIEAFGALKTFLVERDLYEQLQVSYANAAVGGCMYNLNTLNTCEGFRLVYETLRNDAAAHLGLFDIDETLYQDESYRVFLRNLQSLTVDEYVCGLYREAREERDLFVFLDSVAYRNQEKLARMFQSETTKRLAAMQVLEQRDIELERMGWERDRLTRELDARTRELEACRQELADTRLLFHQHMHAAEQKVGEIICYIPRIIQRQLLKLFR